MDLLAAVSVDGLKIGAWVLAIAVGVLMYLWYPRKLRWAALGAVAAFVAASVGSGLYVLAHPGDPRWPAGAELTAPSLSGTPLVGEHLRQLDAVMGDVVGGVNSVRAFLDALPVALDFFTMAGWGCLAALPLAIIALAGSYLEQRRRRAEFERYKSTVEELQQQLRDVQRFVNYPVR